MEDVAFEVQPGEPAALPNRPKNRHKRERDVSHLCPTSVRLAQRKDELLKAWRDRKSSASSGSLHSNDDSHGKKSKREGKCNEENPVSTNASSETDDSKDEEYTVSDEDDYSKNGAEILNDVPKISNDSSDDECCKDIDCSSSSSSSATNIENHRHRW